MVLSKEQAAQLYALNMAQYGDLKTRLLAINAGEWDTLVFQHSRQPLGRDREFVRVGARREFCSRVASDYLQPCATFLSSALKEAAMSEAVRPQAIVIAVAHLCVSCRPGGHRNCRHLCAQRLIACGTLCTGRLQRHGLSVSADGGRGLAGLPSRGNTLQGAGESCWARHDWSQLLACTCIRHLRASA